LNIRPLFEMLEGGKTSKLMMTRLQDEEAEAAPEEAPAAEAAGGDAAAGGADVTFPDDYPNSVKHFLLIGCLGMLIGSCVFLWLSMSRPKSSLPHVLMFMASAISCMSFYAMWTGIGVELKTTDTTPRVIFLPRYADLLLTQPLLLATIGLMSKADTSVLVSLVGYDVLMVLTSLIGAMNIAPFKYMWWFAGFIFLILIIVQLVQRFEGANDGYKLCNYIFIGTACVYPLVWMLGSEGTAALGLSQEVGIITVTDLVAKLGFGLYFLFNFEDIMGEADEDGLNQASQQYV
jgi:bacteriorhodopsin